MKNILLLALLGFTLSLAAQDQWTCMTPPPHMPKAGIAVQRDYISSRTDTGILYIPVSFVILGRDDGSGYYSVEKVWEGLCELNADFAPYGIAFYMQGLPRHINHSLMYEMDDEFYYTDSMFSFVAQQNIPNTLNIYIVRTYSSGLTTFRDLEYDNSTYPPTMYNPQNHGIIVGSSMMDVYQNILTHEVGHYLGLWHTFLGWEAYDYRYFADTTTPSSLYLVTVDPDNDTFYYSGIWPVEHLDGSNCLTSGDLICDTPPDYLSFYHSCDVDGKSTIQQKDPTGSPFRSDAWNFMSYGAVECKRHFSDQQVTWMRDVAQGPRNYLLFDQTPSEAITADEITFRYPAENATIGVIDSVALEWDAVPGASYYLVEFGRKLSESFYYPMVREVSQVETQLKVAVRPDFDYYLKVSAMNKYRPCQVLTDTTYFSTSSLTATQEIMVANALFIYPNPTSDVISWKMEDIHDVLADSPVSIFDAQGRMVKQSFAGIHQAVNVSDLSPGIYTLMVSGQSGLFAKRFVKQ